MSLDDKAVAGFRQKLLDDAEYRKRFADSPAAALREAGIDVPEEVTLPPIDAGELERRIEALKASVGADDLAALVEPSKASELDAAVLTQAGDLTNFSRRVESTEEKASVVDDAVFTISAFGTLDW